MLRELGAFLAMFSLLATVVQLGGLARFFGGAALALLGIDLLLTSLAKQQARLAGPDRAAAIGRQTPASVLHGDALPIFKAKKR